MDTEARFGPADYAVFLSVLVVSVLIGLFYGCFRKEGRRNTLSEYLLAGRRMGAVPVSMSLTASFMSGIILLGTPMEIYTYGTMYWDLVFAYLLAMAATAYFFMPVFVDLRITSVYEYLELRFARSVRIFVSILATTQTIIYMAIVVYTPSLALSQVTGVDTYVAATAMFFVCIFYTVLGGMRAVLWTDAIQVAIMFSAMGTIVAKGLGDSGGLQQVWETAVNGSRIEFLNLSAHPMQRHTVWNVVFGAAVQWTALYGVNQAQVQRYLSAKSKSTAKTAIWINYLSLSALLSLCCFSGLLVYSKYEDCDPLTSKRIQQADQLFALYVMETVGAIPGLPGLFVAAVFCGALSTVSSGINAIAATAFEDFAKPMMGSMILSEKAATRTSKVMAVVFGLVSYGLVFVAAQLGGVLQAANTIFGVIGGPILGVFTLGLAFQRIRTKDALNATCIAMAIMTLVGVAANIPIPPKYDYYQHLSKPKLPVSVEGCRNASSFAKVISELEAPGEVSEQESLSDPYYFYIMLLNLCRISYIWYSALGFVLTVAIGLVSSYCCNGCGNKRNFTKNVNPRLLFGWRRPNIGGCDGTELAMLNG